MAELDFRRAAQWLDLTPQQLDILYCAYRIQNRKQDASPKNIQAEYRTQTGKYLMKPNLFNILRALKASGTIKSAKYGAYVIDATGISARMQKKSDEYRGRLQEYEEMSGEIENFFMNITDSTKPPSVEYLDYAPFFNKITREVEKARYYRATAKFPSVISPISRHSEPGRGAYLRTLTKRCLDNRSLDVTYLTALDLDNPYTHAMRFYNDRAKALKECDTILQRLEKKVNALNNLHIYYLDNPYGLDILLPENGVPENLFMFIRDARLNVIGGLRIQSRDIASRARETFRTLCQQATLLEGSAARRILSAKRKELRERYG